MLKKQLLMTIMQKFLSHRKTDISFKLFFIQKSNIKKRRLEVILFFGRSFGVMGSVLGHQGGVASQLGIVENPKR